MPNIYHIFYKKPLLEKWGMFQEEEDAAFALVRNGRMRIDTDRECDYVRFFVPVHDINMCFSKRELYDPLLLARTKKIISYELARAYSGNNLKEKIIEHINILKREAAKNIDVDNEIRMKIARVLLQSTELAVILLIIAENTEIFVSFTHQVGDMMDASSWREVGSNSGLQQTDIYRSSIYITCGGNPFIKPRPEYAHPLYGDGDPALARMMVIAGQELGHYADILRDKKGRKIARHSTNYAISKAKPEVATARKKDVTNIKTIYNQFTKLGLNKTVQTEKNLQFYRQHRKYSSIRLFFELLTKLLSGRLYRKAGKKKFKFIFTMPKNAFPAIYLQMMLTDMLNNLSPDADVYKKEDKTEEEAIMCAEALARVPQQVNKWGHSVTSAILPNLYNIYYYQVIPTCAFAYEQKTGKKIPESRSKIRKPLFLQLKHLFMRN